MDPLPDGSTRRGFTRSIVMRPATPDGGGLSSRGDSQVIRPQITGPPTWAGRPCWRRDSRIARMMRMSASPIRPACARVCFPSRLRKGVHFRGKLIDIRDAVFRVERSAVTILIGEKTEAFITEGGFHGDGALFAKDGVFRDPGRSKGTFAFGSDSGRIVRHKGHGLWHFPKAGTDLG